jgi:SAM-dependent methyltransferase
MIRKPPQGASIADAGAGAKLHAPAAERNADALCDLLDRVAPATGSALELASGTGQHVVAFAARMPGLHWQPTEPDAARRASIDAWSTGSGLINIAPARPLDACRPGWGAKWQGQSLIVLVNLLHLVSTPEARRLVDEAASALAPGGTLVLYGPFMRGDRLTSDGDARFHASLVAQDPQIGYKSDATLTAWMVAAGLDLAAPEEMPANNLAFIARKPAI